MLIIFALMLLFALLSWLCGADSRERYDSPEWERRQQMLARR